MRNPVNDDPIRDIRTAVIEGTGRYGVLDKVLTDMIVYSPTLDFFRQPLVSATLPLVQLSELIDGQWYWTRHGGVWFINEWKLRRPENWTNMEIRGPIPRPS